MLNGREVLIAIVGGTMLTLALSRPQLRWVDRWAGGNRRRRLWSQRGLTAFSLIMGGYAAATVWIALYGQLGREVDALLTVAAGFLFVYAGLVHFEPFVNEWHLRGGFAALLLYLAFILLAVVLGVVAAELALRESLSLAVIAFLVWASASAALTCLCYRYWTQIGARVDHVMRLLLDAITRRNR